MLGSACPPSVPVLTWLLLSVGCAADALGEEPPTQEDEVGCGHSSFFPRIMGGFPAFPKKWPWMGSVQKDGVHMCAGSIIAPQWLLTSANCYTLCAAQTTSGLLCDLNLTVLFGNVLRYWIDPENSLRVPVKQVIIHPNYKEVRLWSWLGHENNVALLKLSQKLNYTDYIAPVCIISPSFELRPGTFCWVAGWGKTRFDEGGRGVPDTTVLQEAEVKILSNDDCDERYRDVSNVPDVVRIISDNMLCCDYSRGRDFCHGDDGSPLVCEIDNTWFQVGIVSWTRGCTRFGTPGVYSRVTRYATWIAKEIAELNYAVSTFMASSRFTPLALLLPISLIMAL